MADSRDPLALLEKTTTSSASHDDGDENPREIKASSSGTEAGKSQDGDSDGGEEEGGSTASLSTILVRLGPDDFFNYGEDQMTDSSLERDAELRKDRVARRPETGFSEWSSSNLKITTASDQRLTAARRSDFGSGPREELQALARNFVNLLGPITLCVVLSVFFRWYLTRSPKEYEPDPPLRSGNSSVVTHIDAQVHLDFMSEFLDGITDSKVLQVLILVSIIIGMVVLVSLILVTAYYFQFYRTLNAFLILMTAFILSQLCLNIIGYLTSTPVDLIFTSILTWNVAVTGTLAIHGYIGPPVVARGYLIALSAYVAAKFATSFQVTVLWGLLGGLALWDFFAVLAPCGPLRILVETAKERGEMLLPSLVYTSGVLSANFGSNTDTTDQDDVIKSRHISVNPEEEFSDYYLASSSRSDSRPARQPLQLGLGDFIFYSLMVDISFSPTTVDMAIGTYLAVIVGLIITLLILLIQKRALPALPISIFLGAIVYFMMGFLTEPQNDLLQRKQVFV